MQDKKVFAALDSKFDTAPTNMPVAKADESLIEDDFEQARAALKQMISKGQTAVEDIMSIARQSDHPRAFEVAGQLIKTTAETAKDLLALQKQKKDLSSVPVLDAPKQIGTQNNIVFSGSTNDLLKLLKNKDEKVIDASDSPSQD